ncbi:unnamed protein product [Cuscuta campestris]|uniref:Fanconi anemia group I protein n=1 Tax=Cuscuta campestris TaxID=132261 RepID=A0A484N3V9_9ASTE|nr:unnamed protein product [Cuscuta campestris]
MATTGTRNPSAVGNPPPAPLLSDTDIVELARQYHPHSSTPLPQFLLSEASHEKLISHLHARAAVPNSSLSVSEYVSALLSLTQLHPSLFSLTSTLILSYTSLFCSSKIPHDRHSLYTIQLFTPHLDYISSSDLVSIADKVLCYVHQITDPDDSHILVLLSNCLRLIRTSREMDNPIHYFNSAVDRMLSFNWSNVFLLKIVEILSDFSFLYKNKKEDLLEKIFNGMKNVDIQDLPGLVYQLLVLASKGFGKREVIEGDLKEEYFKTARVMEKALLRTVNESNCGREHVVPNIVQLGFLMLEGVEEGSHKDFNKLDGIMGPEELGTAMLRSIFEVHDMARNEIIEQCKLRILSLNPEQGLLIVRLLGCLIRRYSYPMLEHISHLKALLDYFTFMNGKVSSHLVTALLPLVKQSHDLQDYIILVLRKAMFRREDSVRYAAISSIIDLVLGEKQHQRADTFSLQESSSQASCSQQAEVLCAAESGLFLELNGSLQRCFYQQARVREILYYGLVKLVLVDPLSAGPVLDFLLPHFFQFYKEDADVQLNAYQCVKSESGKIYIEEPLDCLLSCISWILILQPHGKTGDSSNSWASFGFSLTQENEEGRAWSAETLSNAFSKLRKFLRKGDFEGLLGKTKDASSTPLEEEKRKGTSLILSGIIEVMLNIIITDFGKANDTKKMDLEKEMLEFVRIHESLRKNVCTTRQSGGVKRGSLRLTANDVSERLDISCTVLSEERVPLLGTPAICQLLYTAPESLMLGGSEAPQNHSQPSSGKDSAPYANIFSFALELCMRQLKSYNSAAKEDPMKMLVYGDIKQLGPPLLKMAWFLMSASISDKFIKKDACRKKGVNGKKEHLHSVLVCLKELIKISLLHPGYMDLMDGLLSVPVPEDIPIRGADHGSNDEYAPANAVVMKSDELFIQKCIRPMLYELLAQSFFLEVEVLSNILNLIAAKLLPEERRDFVGNWARGICKRRNVSNPRVAKSFASLALSLSSAPNDMIIAQDMAKELLNVVGKEDSVPKEISSAYSIINKSTSTHIASIILQFLDSTISDIECISIKLKERPCSYKRDCSSQQFGEKTLELVMEETLYSRAGAVVKVASFFVLMNLQDHEAEQLLIMCARFYKNLARISKLCVASKGCKQRLPSMKFQKLVEETFRQLTTPLYTFVANVQTKQQESEKCKGFANKIKRENRCIPDLIYQIEDYEKYLIQLSKASKVNLLRHAKRSTCRDFKIQFAMEQRDGNGDNAVVAETESSSSEGNEAEDEASLAADNRGGGHFSASVEDSECEDEESELDDGAAFNKTKRSKTRIVEDSEEEDAQGIDSPDRKPAAVVRGSGQTMTSQLGR